MHQTGHAEVDQIIAALCAGAGQILGGRLIGIYLYGSLVTGDFDPESSDIDLLVVTAEPIDARDFDVLDQLHQAIAAAHPRWVDRLEVAYLAAAVLRTYREQRSDIAVMSPGEPFHLKDAGKDWLINWWVVRNQGVALIGPPPQALIAPIAHDEFTHAVRVQANDWRTWVAHSQTRPAQAYAIITLCRALYAFTNGEQASKPQAARWAQGQLPEWADLIERALRWRRDWRDVDVDHAANFLETARFVSAVADRIGPVAPAPEGAPRRSDQVSSPLDNET